MKIVFIGGVKFSHAILETILKQGFVVDAVFSYDKSKEKNYSDYTLDEETVVKLKPLFEDIDIKIFMGTWCTDSRKEIPIFYKLMDKLQLDNKKIELIGMTLEKTTPDSLELNQNIINVPTFIFKKNGEEINRIVEFPIETIEKDILEILTTNDYQNPYDF